MHLSNDAHLFISGVPMAGHSKWANIKHKKTKEDAKRGQAFTKLIKEITVVTRQGGGDPASNARLRTLIEKARSINMPQDNITRAIRKGTGELPGVSYEQMTYEGYGPHGIAVIVDALTDNKNRTVASLRHLFSSKGGNLAESGAVSWMFDKKGVIRMVSEKTEDDMLEELLEFDIDDIQCGQEWCNIISAVDALETLKKTLKDKGYTIESADLEWVTKTPTTLDDKQAEKAYEFLQMLEDHDDVQHVFTNLQ